MGGNNSRLNENIYKILISQKYVDRYLSDDKNDESNSKDTQTINDLLENDKLKSKIVKSNEHGKYCLSISGGGTRGIVSLKILKRLIIHVYGSYSLKNHLKMLSNFDLISGSSAGSIVAILFSLGCDLNILEDVFYEVGHELFNRKKMEYFLNMLFHDDNLSKVKKRIIIPAYDTTNNQICFFDSKDHNCLIKDVILASTAAPYYFQPHKFMLNGKLTSFIDGGVIMNKPIFPNKRWICVGTGFSRNQVDMEWGITKIPNYFSNLISILIQANEELALKSENIEVYFDIEMLNVKINMSTKELNPYLNNLNNENILDVNFYDKKIQLEKFERIKNKWSNMIDKFTDVYVPNLKDLDEKKLKELLKDFDLDKNDKDEKLYL